MTRSGLLIVAVAILAGCGSSSLASANYRGMGLSFRYPAAWHRNDCGIPVSSYELGAELGTVDVTTDPRCTQKTLQLGRNGVLVLWKSSGNARARISAIDGRKLTVDGHAARLRITPAAAIGSGCQFLRGAERAMDAAIERSGANLFFVTACLRGPDFTADERAVRQMVQTVRIAKS